MTHKRFNEIVKEETDYIQSLLIKKQAEYNLDSDRMSHFKEAAGITGWTPEKTLLGYNTKHLASIIDMINSGKKFPRELWVEKITDCCNYWILLLGLLEDLDMFSESGESAKKESSKTRLVEDHK